MTHDEFNILIEFANDGTLDGAIKHKSLSNQEEKR